MGGGPAERGRDGTTRRDGGGGGVWRPDWTGEGCPPAEAAEAAGAAARVREGMELASIEQTLGWWTAARAAPGTGAEEGTARRVETARARSLLAALLGEAATAPPVRAGVVEVAAVEAAAVEAMMLKEVAAGEAAVVVKAAVEAVDEAANVLEGDVAAGVEVDKSTTSCSISRAVNT